MIEKVNPSHPDKIADRIAGAIVDLAYKKAGINKLIESEPDAWFKYNPKVAVEVLLGHGTATIIIESSIEFNLDEIQKIVDRIAGHQEVKLISVPQDIELSNNQEGTIRCGDNGIFKGVPLTDEEKILSRIARKIYASNKSDGKYILNGEQLTICQSNIETEITRPFYKALAEQERINGEPKVNPIGDWTGGTNVDSGATNRKLGSDMAQSVTGGGLHGKDLSKADVSINIYAFLKAQETNTPVELVCSIGDTIIDGIEYEKIVDIARKFINSIGGFEKFAEWGLF